MDSETVINSECKTNLLSWQPLMLVVIIKVECESVTCVACI